MSEQNVRNRPSRATYAMGWRWYRGVAIPPVQRTYGVAVRAAVANVARPQAARSITTRLRPGARTQSRSRRPRPEFPAHTAWRNLVRASTVSTSQRPRAFLVRHHPPEGRCAAPSPRDGCDRHCEPSLAGHPDAESGVTCSTIVPKAVPLMRASETRTMSFTPR